MVAFGLVFVKDILAIFAFGILVHANIVVAITWQHYHPEQVVSGKNIRHRNQRQDAYNVKHKTSAPTETKKSIIRAVVESSQPSYRTPRRMNMARTIQQNNWVGKTGSIGEIEGA